MGGATRTGRAEGTPLDTARDAGYFYIMAATTEDPAAVEACREWNAAASERIDPYRLPGRYLNFVSDSDEATPRAAYGDAVWSRLQEVKARVDPDGVFSYDPNRAADRPTAQAPGQSSRNWCTARRRPLDGVHSRPWAVASDVVGS